MRKPALSDDRGKTSKERRARKCHTSVYDVVVVSLKKDYGNNCKEICMYVKSAYREYHVVVVDGVEKRGPNLGMPECSLLVVLGYGMG
jgi:hypothetical protein